MRKPTLLALTSLLTLASLASPAPLSTTGTLTTLTLNVAGLPAILNGNGSGDKRANSILIGQKLATYAFDVVNLQEDFNYHAYIYASDTHPHRTPTSGGVPFGSGLNTLATLPYADLERAKWTQCSLNEGDCLTPKGWTAVTLSLPGGRGEVDVYNLHMDAGSDDADSSARRANFEQLARAIALRSDAKGRAVVVMGDTNSRYTRPHDGLAAFLNETRLKDTWVEVVRGGKAPAPDEQALVCAQPFPTTPDCEVVDKVLYKSGSVTLTPSEWKYLGEEFTDAAGKPLSDHTPVFVRFAFT